MLLFYCLLLFFAGFYFYHPCFCYVLKMLSMDLGYLNPADVKLRVPFQFVPPVEVVQPAAAPKPKPKAAPKQLSMAAFREEKLNEVDKLHVFGKQFHVLESFI